jgi:hypothetical protein
MIKCEMCGRELEYQESVHWNDSDICPECFDKYDVDVLDASLPPVIEPDIDDEPHVYCPICGDEIPPDCSECGC